MDPIEKLLSEFAPARAPDQLDQTMNRLFHRADRRARVRHVLRTTLALAATLAMGVAVGYGWRSSTLEPIPTEVITYVVPVETSNYRSALESPSPVFVESTRPARSRPSSIAVTVLNPGSI